MFATTPPRVLSHTAPGAQVWDNGNNLMRTIKGQGGILTFIYMNPTDPQDPQNDTLMISGASLQAGLLDPNYITLQKDLTTHMKPATMDHLSAGSIGVGTGGIACLETLQSGSGAMARCTQIAASKPQRLTSLASVRLAH